MCEASHCKLWPASYDSPASPDDDDTHYGGGRFLGLTRRDHLPHPIPPTTTPPCGPTYRPFGPRLNRRAGSQAVERAGASSGQVKYSSWSWMALGVSNPLAPTSHFHL